jgi:hypothetical protein
MAGGVGMVKRISVDALAVFHVCVYICAEIDLVHHSLTPVQKGERKGGSKASHSLSPTPPHIGTTSLPHSPLFFPLIPFLPLLVQTSFRAHATATTPLFLLLLHSPAACHSRAASIRWLVATTRPPPALVATFVFFSALQAEALLSTVCIARHLRLLAKV